MYKCTTPTHEFIMSINPADWESFVVSYSQRDTIVLEKTESDPHSIEFIEESDSEYYVLSFKLTQEETKLFSSKDKAYVQIRCKYNNGDVLASEKIMFEIKDVINSKIL